jgi:hypothetical protein
VRHRSLSQCTPPTRLATRAAEIEPTTRALTLFASLMLMLMLCFSSQYIMGPAPGIKTEFWEFPGNDFGADLNQWTSNVRAKKKITKAMAFPHFLILLSKPMICQDRLGTNVNAAV